MIRHKTPSSPRTPSAGPSKLQHHCRLGNEGQPHNAGTAIHICGQHTQAQQYSQLKKTCVSAQLLVAAPAVLRCCSCPSVSQCDLTRPWCVAECLQTCSDPNKVLHLMLYDNCDKCSPEQINLQAMPFKQLAPLDIGRIGIQFREVCVLSSAVLYPVPSSCTCCQLFQQVPKLVQMQNTLTEQPCSSFSSWSLLLCTGRVQMHGCLPADLLDC